uniref:Uncharacterized protein n=1 Tax=Cacopsylla melanoneura TaxID=428564 RepID=A0A8D8VCW2_9HEMI
MPSSSSSNSNHREHHHHPTSTQRGGFEKPMDSKPTSGGRGFYPGQPVKHGGIDPRSSSIVSSSKGPPSSSSRISSSHSSSSSSANVGRNVNSNSSARLHSDLPSSTSPSLHHSSSPNPPPPSFTTASFRNSMQPPPRAGADVENILKEMTEVMPMTPLTAIAATPRKETESKFTFNPATGKMESLLPPPTHRPHRSSVASILGDSVPKVEFPPLRPSPQRSRPSPQRSPSAPVVAKCPPQQQPLSTLYQKHFPSLPLSEDDSDDEFKGASPPSIMLPDEPLTISNPAPLSPIPTLSPQHSPSPIPSPAPSTASQYKKPSHESPASKVNTPRIPCPQDMSQSSSEEVESESSGSESDSSSDTPPPQLVPTPAPAVKEELPTWNLKNFITPSTQTEQDVESKDQDKECDEDSSDTKCSKPPVLIPHAQLLSSMSDSDHEPPLPPAPPVKRSIGRPTRTKRPIKSCTKVPSASSSEDEPEPPRARTTPRTPCNPPPVHSSSPSHSEDEAFVRRHSISPRLTAHAEPKLRRKPAPTLNKVDIPGKKKRGRKRLSKPPESGSDSEDERERPRKKLEPRKRAGRPSLSKPRPRLTMSDSEGETGRPSLSKPRPRPRMSDSEGEGNWRLLTKRHKSDSENSERPVKTNYRSSSDDSVQIENSPPKLHVATPKMSYAENNIPKIDVESVPKQDIKKKETLLKLWGSKGAGKGGKDKGGKGKGGGMIIVDQRSPAVSERIPSPVDMRPTVEPPPPLQYTPTGRPIIMCSISLSKLSHIPSKSRSEEMRIKTELADTRQKEKIKKHPIVNTTTTTTSPYR